MDPSLPLNIGIVFNAFEPRVPSTDERRSEESVAGMAQEVSNAVHTLGHQVSLIPLQKSLLNFLNRIREVNPGILVNLCEGFYGRPQWESNVAGVFELLGLPFTGSGSKTLAICQDKAKAKAILRAHGLPTAPSQLMTGADDPLEIEFPVIIKPNSEDASLGISPDSVVSDLGRFHEQAKKVLETYRQPALVEKYIDGREFNVAVLENQTLEALPVSEIDYSALPPETPKICSYAAKWFEDHPLYRKTPPVCPAPIDDRLRRRLQEAAVGAFRAMECRDYARVDMRMDVEGNFYILEVNPNPDISLNAGYARALKAAEIGYSVFWNFMLDNAQKRNGTHDPADGTAR